MVVGQLVKHQLTSESIFAGQEVHPAFTFCYAAPETLQACVSRGALSKSEGSSEGPEDSLKHEGASNDSQRATPRTQIATAALDMWSLGVMSMELLTNMDKLEPLSGEKEAVKAALGKIAYPWECEVGMFALASIEVLPGLPIEAVRGLIQGCLTREPSERLTAADAVEALLNFDCSDNKSCGSNRFLPA